MQRFSMLFMVTGLVCLGWTPRISADPLETIAVVPFSQTPDGPVSSQIRAGLRSAVDKLGLRLVDNVKDADIVVQYEYKMEGDEHARAVTMRAKASQCITGIILGASSKTTRAFPADDEAERTAAVHKVTSQIGERIVTQMKSHFERARQTGDVYQLMFVGMSLNGKAPFKVNAALKRSCDFVRLRGGDESRFFVTATCKASNKEIQALVERAIRAIYDGQEIEIETTRKNTNHLEFSLNR